MDSRWDLSVRDVAAEGTRLTRLGYGGKRVLIERSETSAEHHIDEFVRSHDEAVIAQWISIIDKIATKPTGSGKPTKVQRALRQKLGDAAWHHLEDNDLLPGLAQPTSRCPG